MKNLTKFGVIFLTLLLALNTTYARDRHKGRGGNGKILKQLNLTDKQKAELRAFRKETKKEDKKALRDKIKAARERMKAAFTSTASDSELLAIHGEIKSLRGQMAEMKFKKMLKMRSILTQEQRVQFQKLKDEMRKSRRNRNDD